MRKNSGFTLLEVILASLIMAFALIPIFRMLTQTGSDSRKQKAEGVAANLAKEKMNWLMAVTTKVNLLTGAGSEQSLGLETIEGNDFDISYKVSAITDGELNVAYPTFKWHDIRSCGSGLESNDLANSTQYAETTKKINDVLRLGTGNVHLADIFLKIKWKLPNEAGYQAQNQLVLLSRRAFFK